ncbi:cyclic GMP-AMP synthase DncV-like nucleotidyltransferase [Thermodesulfobacteriota bacterium]
MADMQTEFKTFHDQIALTSGKKASLRTARNALRDKIRKHFRDVLKLNIPKFHGQGSYSMGTMVNPLNGECDIDDGVYLQHLDTSDKSDWPTPATVHRWLVHATDGHTGQKPIDKRTCVRVPYAGQYHVDLPAYGELNGDYLLAEKGEKGWHRSDPLALTDWFKDRAKVHGEKLCCIVLYLKAWADFQSSRQGKMPNGLILTVLASNHFRADTRDDIALANTLRAIANAVRIIFSVYNPVDASEELTSRLTDQQKSRFQEAISDAANAATEAINIDDRHEASNIWRKQFGDRFPAVEKKDDANQKKAITTGLATVYAAKNPSKPWSSR